MINVEKKIRIQTFDPDFNMLADRLVGQDPELRNGPKELHKGPLKVEVCLFNVDDVQLFKDYLDRLQGALPLEEKKPKKSKKLAFTPENFRKDIVNDLKEMTTAKELMEYLQEMGFVPTGWRLLKEMGYPIKIQPEHHEYTFWARRVKKAKNPLNHKYDPSILVGIQQTEVIVYEGAKVLAKHTLNKATNLTQKVPKSAKMKFPVYLTDQERLRFRFECEALEKDPKLAPSKFYRRWLWDVKNANKGLTLPREEVIPNPYE